VKAIGRYLIVEQSDAPVKTQAGLLVTAQDSAQIRYQEGKVLSVGTDVKHIHEGEVIYYDKVASHKARLGGQSVQIVPESAVVVVM